MEGAHTIGSFAPNQSSWAAWISKSEGQFLELLGNKEKGAPIACPLTGLVASSLKPFPQALNSSCPQAADMLGVHKGLGFILTPAAHHPGDRGTP
jgi:hypothetical protein